MQKLLYFRPGCGLCNRWRALCSALRLAEVQDRKLIINWTYGHECNVDFSALWEPDFEFIQREEYDALTCPHFGKNDFPDLNAAVEEDVIKVTAFQAFDVAGLENDPGWGFYDRKLRVVQERQQLIDSFYNENIKGNKVVAVNVRYDGMVNPKSKRTTPAWFIETMQAIQQKEPDVKFFLVVDSARLHNMLSEAVGKNNCMAIPKATYRHGTPEVTQQSLVDVHLMSKCHFVLGSWQSSMSVMPTALTGVSYADHTTEFPETDFGRVI